MKFKELSAMPEQELKAKLEELTKELVKQNAQIATGTAIKNNGAVTNAKKTIARIHTIMSQKVKKDLKKTQEASASGAVKKA